MGGGGPLKARAIFTFFLGRWEGERVIICLASTHTALVSSPSLAVLHLSTYLPRESPNHCESRDFSRVGGERFLAIPTKQL